MLVRTTEQFYARVEELMKEREWTRYKLARESGIPESTLYNMMSRQSEPKLETFLKVIDGFHISISEFMCPELSELSLSVRQMEMIKLSSGMTNKSLDLAISYMEGLSTKEKGE